MIDYEWLFVLLSRLTFDDNELPSSQKKDRLNTLDVEDLSDDEDNTWSCTKREEDSDVDFDDNSLWQVKTVESQRSTVTQLERLIIKYQILTNRMPTTQWE